MWSHLQCSLRRPSQRQSVCFFALFVELRDTATVNAANLSSRSFSVIYTLVKHFHRTHLHQITILLLGSATGLRHQPVRASPTHSTNADVNKILFFFLIGYAHWMPCSTRIVPRLFGYRFDCSHHHAVSIHKCLRNTFQVCVLPRTRENCTGVTAPMPRTRENCTGVTAPEFFFTSVSALDGVGVRPP